MCVNPPLRYQLPIDWIPVIVVTSLPGSAAPGACDASDAIETSKRQPRAEEQREQRQQAQGRLRLVDSDRRSRLLSMTMLLTCDGCVS